MSENYPEPVTTTPIKLKTLLSGKPLPITLHFPQTLATPLPSK
jgi:hypothetical protein